MLRAVNSKPPSSSDPVPPSISQNIEAMGDYYKREEQRVGSAQRLLERLGDAIGRPLFLGIILIFVGLWMLFNGMATRLGIVAFDPPPFVTLEAIIALAALLITTIVLIGQNRLAKLEQRRGQMELQVNILTEQKTTTIIRLLEELRRDLPMVRDRHDPDAATLQEPTDATQILTALEKEQRAGEGAQKTKP
jgi:uncharacterized membrane protein